MSGIGRDGSPHPEASSPTATGIRAVVVSLAGLGLTAGIQLAIVVLSGSVALFADTVHNAADALTAIPLWIAFHLGRRPPTRRFPYGFHRAEDLAGILIVLAIAASAALAAWEATGRLLAPRDVHHLGWVLAAGLVGFAGNELVAAYRIRVGRRIGSAALVADGQHARTDGLASLGVVAAAAGQALGFPRADPVAGLAITAAILFVLRDAARHVLLRVMDGTEESTIVLFEEVAAGVPGVAHVTGVRARWAGHVLSAELAVSVAPDLTVEEGHAIAEEVRHALLHEVPGLRQVVVHVDPHRHRGPDPHGPAAHHAGA